MGAGRRSLKISSFMRNKTRSVVARIVNMLDRDIKSSFYEVNNSTCSHSIKFLMQSQKVHLEYESAIAHPTAQFFDVAFKGTPLITYLLLGALISVVLQFVSVVFCLMFDFWTVKNVTGRLLLRMWRNIVS